MLERMKELPEEILGFKAVGKVTREDYEEILNPILDEYYTQGKKVKFLYLLGKECDGFTLGAAWDDLKIGVRYFTLFERCAVLTDKEWLANATKWTSSWLPFPVKVFKPEELDQAVTWLNQPPREDNLHVRFIAEKGVAVIEPRGSLGQEDFDLLAQKIDPLIEQNALKGLVFHMKKFPGWENFGSFIKHMRFVKNHHQKLQRVAFSTDSKILDLLPKLGAHFIKADVKAFDEKDLDHAINWVSQAEVVHTKDSDNTAKKS